MKKQTALIAIALVASFGALGLSTYDSILIHERLAAIDAQTPQMTPQDKQAAATANQLSDTIKGLHEQISKANTNMGRVKIRPAPAPQKNPNPQP